MEERRHLEARYHDVLELLQAEGGRIASLQVGALFCVVQAERNRSGLPNCHTVTASAEAAGLPCKAWLIGHHSACFVVCMATMCSVSLVAPHLPAIAPHLPAAPTPGLQPAHAQNGASNQMPPAVAATVFTRPFPHLFFQEAVSSAASEKGLQTFQAQDALAQQLSMQLQLQQADAERQVRLGALCRAGVVRCLSGLGTCCTQISR